VIPIEAGSPEDRVLQGVSDPQEFVLSLVRKAKRRPAKKELTEAEIAAIIKENPIAQFGTQFTDEQLVAMQRSVNQIRKQGLPTRAKLPS